MSVWLGHFIKHKPLISEECTFIFSDPVIITYYFFRLPQIYEEFYHTVNNADHEKDLKWWSNTYGVNMPMNWPQFEVCKYFFFREIIF